MDNVWRKTFAGWATTADYHRRADQAEAAIARGLASSRRPYVAFSGGKDSTVMLHLVLRQRPDITVLHWDYGPYFIPDLVRREIMDNLAGLGARNVQVETSPEYERLGRQARNVLGREYIGKLLPRMAEEGYDLAFVGLRREESRKRSRRIERRESLTSIQECWPVADWTWMDIWAYIVEQTLPYLSLYDARCALVGWDQARFTTLFDPEFDHVSGATVDGVLHWRHRQMP